MNDNGTFVLGENDGAEYKTGIEGWVDRTGRFFGQDEDSARYSSSTHKRCDCGDLMPRYYTSCSKCSLKKRYAEYTNFEVVEWDGVAPLADHASDQFFFSEDEITDYCYDNEIETSDLMLVLCEPNYVTELDIDNLFENEEWPEDVDPEYPDAVKEAIENVNKAIQQWNNDGPISWTPTRKRVVYNG